MQCSEMNKRIKRSDSDNLETPLKINSTSPSVSTSLVNKDNEPVNVSEHLNMDESDNASPSPHPSLSALSVDETCTSPVFAYQYPIVAAILNKLPIRDLLSASQVCSEWSRIGRDVRRLRSNRCWVTLYHPYLGHNQEVFEYFNGYNVSDGAREFVDNAQANGYPSREELIDQQSWENLFPQMREIFQNDFFSAYWEPQLIVVVATSAIDEYMSIEDDNATKLKMMMSEIPETLPCLVSFSYGIVASIPESVPKSLEMENSELPLLSALAIPKVPGLNVKMFTVTKDLNSEYKGEVNSENCKTILNINAEDNVKGIILFHTDIRRASALKDALFCYLKDNPHVAVGGGAHYKNLASVCKEDFPIGAGLIICGNEDVNVASIGLFDPKISRKNEDKLREMKSCEFTDGDSFAFMFACSGRGAHMHRADNVESKLFHQHFPRTNLIGTFTGGEYCHEVIPIPTRDVPPPPKKHANIEFAFATVFVLVSYKYPPRPLTSL